MDATRAWEALDDIELSTPSSAFHSTESHLLTLDSFGIFSDPIRWKGLSPLKGCPVKEPLSLLTYLKPIDCVCGASGKGVYIWQRERVFTQPIRLNLEHTVQSVAVKDRPQYLIICTKSTITFYRIQRGPDEALSFDLVKDRYLRTPSEITCNAVSPHGPVFLGGKNGRVFNLTLEESSSPLISPSVHLGTLGATWRSWLMDALSSVRSLIIDEARNRIYALHSDSTLEAFQAKKNWTQFVKFAHFFKRKIEITSIVLAPKEQGNENCILGFSSDGELHSFEIVCESGPNRTHWSEIWSQFFGTSIPKTSLILRMSTKSVSELVNDQEGVRYRVEALDYHYSTLLLKLQDLCKNEASLVRVRGLMLKGNSPVLMMEDRLHTSVGSSMIASALPPRRWKYPSWRCLDSLTLPYEELTRQFFAASPEYVVCTELDQMLITKDWPCEVLASILRQKSVDGLAVFCGLFGAQETVSMALFLAIQEEEIAMQFALKNADITQALSRGFHIFIKRLLSPIWNKLVFEFHSDEISKSVRFTLSVLEWYLSFLVKLKSVMNRFILGVYSNSTKTSHSFIQTDFYQIVDLNAMIHRLTQILTLLKFFHTARSLEDVDALSPSQQGYLSEKSLKDLAKPIEKESPLTEFLKMLKFDKKWIPTSDEMLQLHSQAPSFFDAVPLTLTDLL